jgi:nucleotide-binding universal stress UspA family protein
LPVDFSDASPQIVFWATSIAETFEAEIHLLFVARRLDHFASMEVPQISISNFEEEVVRGAERTMEQFVENYLEGMEVKTRVVLGDAAEEILGYIDTEGIDMVVIGTHGRKGIGRIVFGSVAERVIQASPVPVITVNPYL